MGLLRMPKITDRNILNWVGVVMILAHLAFLALLIYVLVWTKIPPENKEALLIIIGLVTGNVGNMVQFLFGSTQAAKEQGEALHAVASALPSGDYTVKPGETVHVSTDVTGSDR
jgi:hypothetical protein